MDRYNEEDLITAEVRTEFVTGWYSGTIESYNRSTRCAPRRDSLFERARGGGKRRARAPGAAVRAAPRRRSTADAAGARRYYHVRYEDGDQADYSRAELRRILVRAAPSPLAAPRPAAPAPSPVVRAGAPRAA